MPVIKRTHIMTPDELEEEFGRTLLTQAREAVECSDQIIALYWARWTNTQIAEELNYSPITIGAYLKTLRNVSLALIPERKWLSDHFVTEEDIRRTKLGVLCNRTHDFEGTGKSLRFTRPTLKGRKGSGDCLICSRITARVRDAERSEKRKSPYRHPDLLPLPGVSFSVSLPDHLLPVLRELK